LRTVSRIVLRDTGIDIGTTRQVLQNRAGFSNSVEERPSLRNQHTRALKLDVQLWYCNPVVKLDSTNLGIFI